MTSEGRLVRPRLKFETQFTQLPNAWLRDENLSLKARGLLALLMSHDAGWSVTIKSLSFGGKDGMTAVRGAVQELEENGYLARIQTRNNRGQLGHIWWEVRDPSDTQKSRSEPLSGFPTTGNPTTGNPTTENRTTIEEQVKEDLLLNKANPSTRAGAERDGLPPGVYPSPDDIGPAAQKRFQDTIRAKCPNRTNGLPHRYVSADLTCAHCGITEKQYWAGNEIRYKADDDAAVAS